MTRTELRRRWRNIGDNTRQVVGLAIAGLLFALPVAIALIAGAYFLGTAAGTDAFADRLTFARAAVSAVWGYAVFFTALRTLQEQNTLDAPEMVLTTVPATDAAIGVLLAEYAVVAGVAALPIVGVAVAFAVGAGSAASLLVVPAVLFAVLAFGLACGYVIGLAAKAIAARYAVIARFKTVIGVVAFAAYFAVFATGAWNSLAAPVFAVVEATPLGWFADLALVVAPDDAIGFVRPAAAAATLAVALPAVTWVAIALASTLWYTDPAQPDRGDEGSGIRATPASATDDDASSAAGSAGADAAALSVEHALATGISDRLLGGRVPRPMLRIAQKSWRRAYRAPIKLQYAVIPVFFLITPIQQSIQAGRVSTVLPASVAIYGAWAAGAAFTLNPLGDEGSVLPTTLTTPVSGTELLSGLVLAGVAVGAPLTTVLAVVLGVLSPLTAVGTLAIGALGIVLCVGACAIAAGVGTAFPKFERTELTRGREAVVPSLSAFAVYSLALLAVALPGLLGGVPLVADWAGDALGASGRVVTLGGLGLTTVLAAAAGWIATRSAGETIDEYTL